MRSLARGVRGSVEVRVRRKRREHREWERLATEDLAPQVLRGLAEQITVPRRYDVPAALADLVVELARPPAGVPAVDPRPVEPPEEVARRAIEVHQPERADDLPPPERRLVDGHGATEGAQRQRGVELDRAAPEEHTGRVHDISPRGQDL